MAVAYEQGLLRPLRPLRDYPKRQKSDKYYRFHQNKGHDTEDSIHLKVASEKLIRKGYLEEFVSAESNKKKGKDYKNYWKDRKASPGHRSRLPDRRRKHSPDRRGRSTENLPTLGEVGFISGGPSSGDTMNERKKLVRAARGSHVFTAQLAVQIFNIQEKPEEISFNDGDLDEPRDRHNDAWLSRQH